MHSLYAVPPPLSGLPTSICASAGPPSILTSSFCLPVASFTNRLPPEKVLRQSASGATGQLGHGVVARSDTVVPALFSGVNGSPQVKSTELLCVDAVPTRCRLCPSP